MPPNEQKDEQSSVESPTTALSTVTQAKKKPQKRKKREVLTGERARQASTLWRLAGPTGAITDEQVADIIGVTYGVLRGWLRYNTVPVDAETGHPIPSGEGLRTTRVRARAQHVAHYLGKVEKSIQVAEANEDPHGIRMGATWMLEKLNPKMFDHEQGEDGENQTGVMKIKEPKTSEEWQKKWSPSVNEKPSE